MTLFENRNSNTSEIDAQLCRLQKALNTNPAKGGLDVLKMARCKDLEERHRLTALRYLLNYGNLTQETACGLIELLQEAVRGEQPASFVNMVLMVIRGHNILDRRSNNPMPVVDTRLVLETLANQTEDPAIQCMTISLLGIFGDIRTIERMCLVPVLDQASYEGAMNEMVKAITGRSINLLHVNPYTFERLMGQMLIKMGHRDVNVTQRTKDGGVDIEAYKGHKRVLVQCKRQIEPIKPSVLRKFDFDIHGRNAAYGMFITTSEFSKTAYKYVKTGRQRLDWKLRLMNGQKVLKELNEHFKHSNPEIEKFIIDANEPKQGEHFSGWIF